MNLSEIVFYDDFVNEIFLLSIFTNVFEWHCLQSQELIIKNQYGILIFLN